MQLGAVTAVAVAMLAGAAIGLRPPAPEPDRAQPNPVATEPTPPADEGERTTQGARPSPTPRPTDVATPEPEPTDEPDPPPADLVDDVRALLEDEEVADVEALSVMVTDEAGAVVAEHQAREAVMPASTNKLVTAAAALHLLGPEYRYVTRAVATGPIEDGVLDGDLVMVGVGDPALASPTYADEVYPARPHTPIDALAEGIVDAGVEEITGAVIGDPGPFADEPEAAGWRERYFASLDATRASGLTVDAGRRIVERGGGIFGEMAEDPAVVTAEVLHELLDDREVEVGDEATRGTAPASAAEIARVQSPPMIDLLGHVVRRSDNHMADAVFRTLGARTGDGTWSGGDVAARAALSDLDVDWSGAVLADGSGLSRDDRLSAEMLISVDRALTQRHGEQWRALMAVMGESGTLSSRLRGTPAQGRVTGKTGSLRDARALVARVDSEGDHVYYFAVLGAELDPDEIGVVRGLMDDLALRLAEG